MNEIEEAAALLVKAHRNIETTAVTLPLLTTEQAYLVQKKVMHDLGIQLKDITCWKVGMRTLLDEPIFAPIYPNLIHAKGDVLRCNNYRDLHVELEWGYRLTKSIAFNDFHAELDSLDDYFSNPLACFELVDSRLSTDLSNNREAKLADNQITSGIVIGDPIPVSLLENIAQTSHQLICDGQLLLENKGGHPLNDPRIALLKGAKKLLQRVSSLPEGAMLLTGSWNGLVPIENYSNVSANFSGQAEVSFLLLRD